MLLQVGNVTIAEEKHPNRIGPTAVQMMGTGFVKMKTPFASGTKLILKDNKATVIEPDIGVNENLCPVQGREIPDGTYDLSGQPRQWRFQNTTKQAWIGRAVRYWAAATTTEPVTQHRWTYATTAKEDAVNGSPIGDWVANKRIQFQSVSSHTAGGAQEDVTKMELLNAANDAYAEITVSFSIPASETAIFTWTESVYGGGTIYATEEGVRIIVVWMSQDAATSFPASTVDVYDGTTHRLGPISLSYDPATGKPDFTSTQCDYYANDVLNDTGLPFNYNALWVTDTGSQIIAKITVTSGSWGADQTRDIDITHALQDGTP